MTLIINPGSKVPLGTYEVALKKAKKWLRSMKDDFGDDVEITKNEQTDSRWLFTFKHKITHKEATLEIDGLTDEQLAKIVFTPKVYWNGCSLSEPKAEDFLPDGWDWNAKINYYKK